MASVDRLRNLIARRGLDAICEPRAIKRVRHPSHPNLVQLRYDQLGSPMGDPIVRVCRGLVLDEADDWRVVSYPYDKFFNHGEGHAAPIDWETATVAEKLDGTLCTLYHYGGVWHVATTGTPDGSGAVRNRLGQSDTFSALFWRAWRECGMSMPPDDAVGYSMMFELCTPENVVVVPQSEYRVTLHGARRLDPDRGYPEECPASAAPSDWTIVRTFPLGSMSETLEAARSLSGAEQEGFVVRDGRFNRVKVKSPSYLALHRLAGRCNDSSRPVLEAILVGRGDDVESLWPAYRDEVRALRARVADLVRTGTALFARHRGAPSRRDFALAVKDHPLAAGLFRMWTGEVTDLGDWLSRQDARKVERWIGAGIG